MGANFLVSLNAKGYDNPVFLQVLRRLSEEAPLVHLTNEKLEPVGKDLVASARAWIVAGGDGTLHHAVNSLLRLPREQRCPIWYLPFGTGNDFARTVGLIANDPMEPWKLPSRTAVPAWKWPPENAALATSSIWPRAVSLRR